MLTLNTTIVLKSEPLLFFSPNISFQYILVDFNIDFYPETILGAKGRAVSEINNVFLCFHGHYSLMKEKIQRANKNLQDDK